MWWTSWWCLKESGEETVEWAETGLNLVNYIPTRCSGHLRATHMSEDRLPPSRIPVQIVIHFISFHFISFHFISSLYNKILIMSIHRQDRRSVLIPLQPNTPLKRRQPRRNPLAYHPTTISTTTHGKRSARTYQQQGSTSPSLLHRRHGP